MQQRAIETRKKIIDAAMIMYVKKGYHYTTVDEIAAEAGVSTGIAYRYFINKKELLLATIEDAFSNIKSISGTTDADFAKIDSFEAMIGYALDQFELIHKKYYGIHEELESLRHSDKDVKSLYDQIETKAITALIENAPEQFKQLPNIREKVYLAIGLMENYCHMIMDDKFRNLDFSFMRCRTVHTVKSLFGE